MTSTSEQMPSRQYDGFTRAIHRISRTVSAGETVAVLIVLIRDVEQLCASFGHVAAIRLIDDYYAGMSASLREGDAIERIGDRKFVLLLKGLKNHGYVRLAAEKVESILRRVCREHAPPFDVTVSVGVSMCPTDSEEATELMRYAEIASIGGVQKGESVSFYDEGNAAKLVADWGLKERLERALQGGDLELYYQPKICLVSNRIAGAEALMRWYEPEMGAVAPDVFVELAESTGQIVDLTRFAIQNVCRQLANWQHSLPDLVVALNVTPSVIISREIVDVLRTAGNIWGVPFDKIALEVTENALLEDRETSHMVLEELRSLNVHVSIDDFGTGYSSLSYLKDIPADELKIDRSFVMGMLTDANDMKIVEHAVRIARSFGLEVVAEGVESGAALDVLRELKCDYAQGYFISRPLPVMEFEEFCSNWSAG